MLLKKKLIRIFIILVILFVSGVTAVLSVNAYVKHAGGENIISPDKINEIGEADCIIILGCQVFSDGTLSAMLHDRVMRGIELYESKAAPKLIVSGDHGRKEYDEVNAMKKYAIDAGIPSENIFMDHAGFSTYESMYRAKEIFKAEKIIVVTQEYHLYRALYIAQKLGMEAYGVSSDYRPYYGQTYREVREILARCKDFATTLFKPEPTFLGEAIPVSGNGNLTND
ncbi:MAG: ElyC/SanA/YdcF family protein [Clostridia bacterium]|nr:ElyC/SanA/YdcF family protein [Clostridia bacterium]